MEEDAPSLDLAVDVEFKLSDVPAPSTPPATRNHSPKEIEQKRRGVRRYDILGVTIN